MELGTSSGNFEEKEIFLKLEELYSEHCFNRGILYKLYKLGRNFINFLEVWVSLCKLWNNRKSSVNFWEVESTFQRFVELPTSWWNFWEALGITDKLCGLEQSSGSIVWVYGTEIKLKKCYGCRGTFVGIHDIFLEFCWTVSTCCVSVIGVVLT